ncbi:hypothetical protein F4678DRAFT_464914 [Xylaria arbuscula]|nr:hypothetical protein F4678DRAFT_464914 [Xylaria arbuscula]
MDSHFIEPKLKNHCLYIALEYPRSPEIQKEHQPELLPEYLRLQTDGQPELEYTWSFMLAFEKGGCLHLKRYTIEWTLDAQHDFQEKRDRCIPNYHLLSKDCIIETSFTEPDLLGSFPKLMILLTSQFVDMKDFEIFLANHDWNQGTAYGSHLTHLWARRVLIDYAAINIDETSSERAPQFFLWEHKLNLKYHTVMFVEDAARTYVRRNQELHPYDFDSSASNSWNLKRHVHVYNMYQYICSLSYMEKKNNGVDD